MRVPLPIFIRSITCLVCALACSASLWCASFPSAHSLSDSMRYAGKVNAPDFPQGAPWLNVSAPLSIKDLRGKIVLLDFWTYCCINCIHILPDLKKLEAKYANELVVIGVHSGKFENEGNTDNIREAIVRYEIEHPVVNDKDFTIWDAYTARAWPTLILVDPYGKVVGMVSGEGNYDSLDQAIGTMVKEFSALGALDRTPFAVSLERSTRTPSLLSYPGKIVADSVARLLYFTDSNNNRLVIAGFDGTVQDVIGSGMKGATDGDYRTARFFRPQGLTLNTQRDKLYVADTENHLIREVHLPTKTVRTIAGTGTQGVEFNREGIGRAVALNSPWDITCIQQTQAQGTTKEDLLFVAMAGYHQIWTLNPITGEARIYAGSGQEDIDDGLLREASLAQTSGIAVRGDTLYIADSETSSIRSLPMVGRGRVQTLIGTGLFDFGDRDGSWSTAQLQHCIGVKAHQDKLYIADTYNHKIKVIDLSAHTITSLIGTGKRGRADGTIIQGITSTGLAQLNEPNDMVVVDNMMFITDTNNDAIRVADLRTGIVSTLELKGLERYVITRESRVTMSMAEPELIIAPSARSLRIHLQLPDGTKPTPMAPHDVRLRSKNPALVSLDSTALPALIEALVAHRTAEMPLRIMPHPSTATTTITLEYDIYFCEEKNEGRCYFKTIAIEIPLRILSTGTAQPMITLKAER